MTMPGVYDLERFGNARILHITGYACAASGRCFFREPSVNLGVGADGGATAASGRQEPFSTASASVPTAPMPMPSPALNSRKRAARFGKLGGFAHLKTLIDRLRSDVGQRALDAARRRRSLAGHGPVQHRCRAPTWSMPQTCSASRR